MKKSNPFAQKSEAKGEGKMPPKSGFMAMQAADGKKDKKSKKGKKNGGNPFAKGK